MVSGKLRGPRSHRTRPRRKELRGRRWSEGSSPPSPVAPGGVRRSMVVTAVPLLIAAHVRPMALDASAVEGLLELPKELLVRPDLVRLDTAVEAERREPTCHLADVPLDRVEPVAAVGDVRGADVLRGRQEVAGPDGQQRAQR